MQKIIYRFSRKNLQYDIIMIHSAVRFIMKQININYLVARHPGMLTVLRRKRHDF